MTVVSVAARPADVAVAAAALGGSRQNWWEADAVLAPAAEHLALCYSESWTEVVALLLTTLTKQGLDIIIVMIQ